MYEDLSLDEEFSLITGTGKKVGEITVYPLTIKEIGNIGFEQYQALLSTVLVTKDVFEGLTEEQLEQIEDFDVVVSNCSHSVEYKQGVERALTMLLREEVKYLEDYQFFIVGDVSEKRLISRENFSEIADIARKQNVLQKPKKKKRQPKENKKIRELRAKMEKGRKMMAEAKQQKTTTTIVDLIKVVATFGRNFETIADWTLYQIYQAHSIFLKEEDYKQRFDTYLAGGDPKKLKLDTHWSSLK